MNPGTTPCTHCFECLAVGPTTSPQDPQGCASRLTRVLYGLPFEFHPRGAARPRFVMHAPSSVCSLLHACVAGIAAQWAAEFQKFAPSNNCSFFLSFLFQSDNCFPLACTHCRSCQITPALTHVCLHAGLTVVPFFLPQHRWQFSDVIDKFDEPYELPPVAGERFSL